MAEVIDVQEAGATPAPTEAAYWAASGLSVEEKLNLMLAQQATILDLAAGLAAGGAELGKLVEQFTGGPQGKLLAKFLGG